MKVRPGTNIDGDIDDLCAPALLLAWPDVEITGITTVAEHAGKRAGYARYALALAGRSEVVVAAGADVRLDCFRLPTGLPSEERLLARNDTAVGWSARGGAGPPRAQHRE